MHHLPISAISLLLVLGTVTSGPSGGWVDLIESLGTIGALILFLFGFKSGWWVLGQTHDRALERLDRLEAKLDRHRETLENETIPLLVRATDTMSRFLDREGGHE